MIYVEISKKDWVVQFMKYMLDGGEVEGETSTTLSILVDSIPEVDKTKLVDAEGHPMGATLKYDSTNKVFFYEYKRRPRRPEESIPLLESEMTTLKTENEQLKRQTGLLTANEYYDSLDKVNTPLADLQAAKIAALKETCGQKIDNGFYSAVTGANYAFSLLDQMNFTQQLILNISKPQNVFWKTEDRGLVEHTPEQFVAVVMDAEKHKRDMITRYWQLKAVVIGATSNEEVDSITWDTTSI